MFLSSYLVFSIWILVSLQLDTMLLMPSWLYVFKAAKMANDSECLLILLCYYVVIKLTVSS